MIGYLVRRLGLTLLVLVTGCGGTTLVVQSDTSWAGSVDGYGAVSGRFRAEYDLGDAAGRCWTISKTTEAGTLQVYSKTSEWGSNRATLWISTLWLARVRQAVNPWIERCIFHKDGRKQLAVEPANTSARAPVDEMSANPSSCCETPVTTADRPAAAKNCSARSTR